MKNNVYILAAALLLCSFAYSEEEPTSMKLIESKYHRFYAGPDVFVLHKKVDEVIRLGTFGEYRIDSTFNAVFGGLRLGYDYLKPQEFYFGMDALASMGRSFFRAKYSFSGPYISNNKSEKTPFFVNIEQRYGYNFQSPLSVRSTLIPFAGIGWFYIRPQFDSSYFLSNWFYGAAGLRVTQEFYESFDAGFNLKAMYTFAGNVGNFWGYEVALPLTWRVGTLKKWDLQFQPYLLKLDINDIGYILGVRLQAGYSF